MAGTITRLTRSARRRAAKAIAGPHDAPPAPPPLAPVAPAPRSDRVAGSLRDHQRDQSNRPLVLDSVSPGQLLAELSARMHAGALVPAEAAAMVAMELDAHGTAERENRFGLERLRSTFSSFPAGLSTDGVFVELGCGSLNPLANMMMYRLLGARLGIAVDLDTPKDERFVAWGVARVAAAMAVDPSLVAWWPVSRADVAARLEGFDMVKLWNGDPAGIDADRLQLWHRSAEALPLDDGAADYVFSDSFLEHVEDAEAVVAEMARVVKPGGWTWHQIDGQDHTIYTDPSAAPLGFLGTPKGPALVNESNRVRPLEFVPMFEEAGFELVAALPHHYVPPTDEDRRAFAEPWRSMPEEVLAARGLSASFRRR